MSHRLSRTVWQYSLLAMVFAGLGLFLIYPILLTVESAFASDPTRGLRWTDLGATFTLEHIGLVFADPKLVEGLKNALYMAVGTTVLSIALALPLAVLAAQYRFPGKGIFSALILVPLILPPFVGALGFKALFGRQGSFNAAFGTELDLLADGRLLGVIIVQALHLYPIIYLNATAALANLDPALDEAAENLGAGWWRRFFGITMPLIRPGLFAGGTIVFIWSFTELGTPLMFEYYAVTPVQIFRGLREVETSAQPYALTVVLLFFAVGFYIVGRVLFGGRAHAMYAKASRASAEVRLRGPAAWAATGAFTFVIGLALLPHIGVILTSLAAPGQWYRSAVPTEFTFVHFDQALGHGDSFNAIMNSLKLSAAAMVLAIFIGLIVGYLIVRTKVRGRNVLDTLCMLPLAVPGLVMAFGYVAMTLRWPFGRGDPLEGAFSVVAADPNPFPLLIIAYTVRRLPYIVRSTVAGLQQTSGELEDAAVNLGASRTLAIRKIVVPLIMANLIAGGLLVFSFSMLEVSDSLILAQQAQHYPITKAIYAFTGRLGDGPYIASAMGVWGMALLTVTLVGASVLLGKKLGSIFRV
ncbi:MAG: iron ABC transporter permease [Phycisphaerales bacterium]|nr:iron ABC transporter permease [Phycisphaerales bacterium]